MHNAQCTIKRAEIRPLFFCAFNLSGEPFNSLFQFSSPRKFPCGASLRPAHDRGRVAFPPSAIFLKGTSGRRPLRVRFVGGAKTFFSANQVGYYLRRSPQKIFHFQFSIFNLKSTDRSQCFHCALCIASASQHHFPHLQQKLFFFS